MFNVYSYPNLPQSLSAKVHRGSIVKILSTLPLLGMINISPSSFGKEISFSFSSPFGKRLFPSSSRYGKIPVLPTSLSMKDIYFLFGVNHESSYHFPHWLLSCVAVCPGPENATEFPSAKLKSEELFWTSQHKMTNIIHLSIIYK